MLDEAQNDELIRQTAIRHSVAPELLNELLALAPEFENFDIYGVKTEFTRAVARILDGVEAARRNDAKP